MDGYSRLVAWLKVLLPLMALGILSTLFLLSHKIDSTTAIPFAATEIQDRVRDQQVTGPFFSGSTESGDQYAMSALKMSTGQTNGATVAEELSIQLDLASGTRVILTSDTGTVDMSEDTLTLSNNVVITTSTAYTVHSEGLTSRLSQLDVKSHQKVIATGPLGDITAGAMHLTVPEKGNTAQLVFKNGVKLIYDPETTKD